MEGLLSQTTLETAVSVAGTFPAFRVTSIDLRTLPNKLSNGHLCQRLVFTGRLQLTLWLYD